jgi:hypothetical protein
MGRTPDCQSKAHDGAVFIRFDNCIYINCSCNY